MTLTAHQQNELRKYEEFASKLEKEPPINCEFKVGDFVTFTNDYGVFFRQPKKVIGFDDGSLNGRFIYTEGDAYWFPSKPNQLHKAEVNATGCILVRELTPFTLYKFANHLLEDTDWELLIRDSEFHAVFVNDKSLELVTYCEGDVIWATALNHKMHGAEITRNFQFMAEG